MEKLAGREGRASSALPAKLSRWRASRKVIVQEVDRAHLDAMAPAIRG